eukprot:jgi/Galph1/5157/GphlegSOOS_G3797.1
MEFLYAPICPYAQRTWILLKKLKVPYKEKIIELRKDNREPWFLELNPLGKVPVLVVHNQQEQDIVYESLVCNEYLNEVYGSNKYLPEKPGKRALARILAIRVDGLVSTLFGLLKTDPQEDPGKEKELQEELHKQLKVINDQVQASGGPYLLGSDLTLADIAYIPFVERCSMVLSEFRGHDIQKYPLPYFCKWLNQWNQDPEYNETKLSRDQLVSVYKKYANENIVKRLNL